MNHEELLNLYLEKLKNKTVEIMEEGDNPSVLEALKRALEYIEGEMNGY